MALFHVKLVALLLSCLLPSVLAKDPHRHLIDLAAANNGLIPLDEATFDLLTSDKRTWSSTIQFTALDQRRRCLPCKEFFPSFAAVAQSWATVPKEHRDNHFFATVDFDATPTVFQKLSLVSAPVVFAYPPAQGPRKPATGKIQPVKYDFSNGFGAQALAEQLSHRTPIPIPYKAPINWTNLFHVCVFLVAVYPIVYALAPYMKNRWFWAALTNFPIFVLTSGFMFSHIRGVPSTGPNGEWIAQGFQTQFGQEVPVAAGIYSIIGLSFFVFLYIVPRTRSPGRQRLQLYFWTVIQIVVFSMLLSIFRVKNRGYPFGLLF